MLVGWIDETLDRLGGSEVFTKIDLAWVRGSQ